MTPDVVAVRALPNYQIEVRFADGEVRLFDMLPYLGYPAFSDLRTESLFMRAKILHGTVAWTEEIDISPDTLYLKGDRCSQGSSPL
jgi:hypothetical protein